MPCLPAVGMCYATGSWLAPLSLPLLLEFTGTAATGPHILPLLCFFSLLLLFPRPARIPSVAAKLTIIEALP